ncbi:MAG: Sec-independent protein translocase protein TatB [Cellvibrio sp.]
MFDIGFAEIIVCAIVALIVIGPERMPEAVRTIGLWIGRVKRSLRETRTEIERQIGVDDIRRQLHNEEIMQTLENARRDMDNILSETQQSINSIQHQYQEEPELPYHSHMNEQPSEQAAQLEAPVNSEIVADPIKDSAKVTTLADNKPPLENQVTSDNRVSLDKKVSL